MKFPHRREFLHLAAGAAVALVLLLSFIDLAAWSQPNTTFKIIVPYAPGGGGSVLARLVAEQIERTQMVSVVVENRPQAGTVVGTEAVARAAPDGNTLLITNPAIIINAHLRKQNYDPIRSFEAICRLATTPLFITVNSASPYRTLADMLNAARAKPGAISAASSSLFVQTSLEVLKRRANVDITVVPFPGSAPAVNALLGDHVTVLTDNYATVAEHIKAGKLRAIAIASRERLKELPDVPTVTEAGFKDYVFESWWGMFAPSRAPQQVLNQLADWSAAAMRVPEVRQKLEPLGFYPATLCGSQFATYYQGQFEELGSLLREANIKGE